MKQDEIIWQNEVLEMARLAGLPAKHPDWIKAYLAFAELVAQREREACAKLFDKRNTGTGFYEPHEPAEIIRAGVEA